MRWFILTACSVALLALSTPAFPQSSASQRGTASGSVRPGEGPILEEFSFTGLRHIVPAAVAAQISLRVGEHADQKKIERTVRTLARLGWFESIQVEAGNSAILASHATEESEGIVIIIHLKEFPFLSKVEYSGSRLLLQKQIEKMLEDKKLTPQPGKPADPAALHQISLAIRSGLNELGHPEATVRIAREDASNATVKVRFEINDGPLLPVRRVVFDGQPEISTKLLRAQMRNVAPWKPFASWRGKNAYTREAWEADSERILAYYQNNGYPAARIGKARVTKIKESSRRLLPWPHDVARAGLSVSIPVQAGPFYRFDSLGPSPTLRKTAEACTGKLAPTPASEAGKPYSSQVIENMRRTWTVRIQPHPKDDTVSFRAVEAIPAFDTDNQTVHVTFDLSDSQPYVVQRIDFQGLHRFSDRYVRRRILLREGQPVNDRALEAGLARLARTGYFKPIHKEDIHVQLDNAARTANVAIKVQEIGKQRASLVGGNSQFGSTLGIAYTVFGLLNREELLSTQLDGGPESLQVLLGLAKDGVFGTRSSLVFSVFNNIIRPRFARSATGPFFTSRNEGISIPWTYPLNDADSLGVNFTLSRATSAYALGTPHGLTNLPPIEFRSRVSSRTIGVGWLRDTGNERVVFSNSVSGGWLGGGENVVRSSAQYGRIFHDPFFSSPGNWAFRTTLIGAGSYQGGMPFYARYFSGDDLVRGLRPGELGPYAVTSSTTDSGTARYSAAPAGASLLGAANVEYRFPLAAGVQAAGFFDLGSGWLLPNWLGPSKPILLGATNGVLHGSTGIEFRWTVPGVQVPVRAYYGVNVLRLNRFISLSANSLFHAHNRYSAFGWGLGMLF